MKLNEKIMNLRKQHGLSQEELGNKLNVSRQAVYKWETEQTQPSIDKINELAKYFNVSYNYLLNDEIDELPNNDEIKNTANNTNNKSVLKLFIKTLAILVTIYLIISIYKFIIIFKNYKLANSFSEDNYWYSQEWNNNNNILSHVTTTKIADKLIQIFSSLNKDIEEPSNFYFKDYTNKLFYAFTYQKESDTFICNDETIALSSEELDILFSTDKELKEITLNNIPSNFKDILLKSLNPMYIVKNKELILYTNDAVSKVYLNNDGLIERFIRKDNDNNVLKITYSYDYVQDHFNNKSITNPFEDEKYKDRIVKFEDLIEN